MRTLRYSLIMMICLPLVYALSVGPAAWVCDKVDPDCNGKTGRFLLAVYSPLGTIADRTGNLELLLQYSSYFVEIKGL